MVVNDELLNAVESIARKAGHVILEIYDQEFSVREKEDKSPLTEADASAQAIISKELSSLTPGLPILSEEAIGDFSGPDVNSRYWLVDPLDGTKEFIKRNGEFTVNIALIESGRPVLGVVYAPVLDIMYLAASALGAFKSSKSGPRTQIRVSRHTAGTPWRVVGSRSHSGDSLLTFLQRLGPHELVPMGSSLKLCLVAEGRADLYPRLGPTSLWDTAAAQCIVVESGGGVIQLTGEPLSYSDTSTLLNPFFLVHGNSDMDWRSCFK